ncbi:MAG: flagellar biosynthesis protein FlgF, partial [Buchnera aphidicola]|nr:flagellar biosynthesis protein FlgF [Buchnera aphidicola]
HNFSPGTPNYTNRDLDVYIKDNGWLTVIDQNGKEAYTKNGHLKINLKGELTSQNYNIVGKDKKIKIPPE